MNKHQYETQIEALEGQIRVESVKSKTSDVLRAKYDATTAEAVARQAGVKSQTAVQNVLTEQHRLTQARQDTKLQQLAAAQKQQDVESANRELPLRKRVLDIKYESLRVDTESAKKLLVDRKNYLKQLGSI
jgi:23S rRNA maturation-related 3'-5' exoribonuclease YhaM